MEKKDCLFNDYDMGDIAKSHWALEMPRVFQAKRFLNEQVIPFLEENGHISASVEFDRSLRFEDTYLETKHYYYTLIRQEGLDIVLQRSSTCITAFLLFKIPTVDLTARDTTMQLNYCHSKTPYWKNAHIMVVVQATGEYSDDGDDIEREQAIMNSIAYLKKLSKDSLVAFYREQIENSATVERGTAVELKCLFNDFDSFQALPDNDYSYVMFQLSCLHIYMAGKQYG